MTTQTPLIHVPILLGPTAAGKTAIALSLAKRHHWEIISCDSRQIYRHMDIGTAKPTLDELKQVPHHLVDCINPSEPYSVHAFVKNALETIRDLAKKGRTGFVCGGTGLYGEGLRKGVGPQVESDPVLREKLSKRAAVEGSAALWFELMSVDPESAKRIHENDAQRIIRALAVHCQTGAKLSDLQGRLMPPQDIEFKAAVIIPPRDVLYERINARVDRMAAQGLWNEFRALRDRGYHDTSPGMQCVGYRELFAVERGECTLPEALEKIKQNSRNYAKRQITWFNTHNKEEIIEWCEDQRELEGRVEIAVM